ncbi:MAG TPA: hypothetical protein VMT24_05850, partial [Aggregatilineaceae bacterium]|nr:hypothetical protein [Aggregatilineaceae bacterium]
MGADFHIIRDYEPYNTLDWTASDHEGTYEVELSVRNVDTGETALTSALFEMTSRITADTPVISSTSNPLVFLYSAPPCPAGGQMFVRFLSPEGYEQRTPSKPCVAGSSMNFYLAGLKSNSVYSVNHTLQVGGNSTDGPVLPLTTSSVSFPIPSYTVLKPSPQPESEGLLLQAAIFYYNVAVATDLDGNLVWYYPGVLSYLTRPAAGGFFFGVNEDATQGASAQ